MSSFVHVRCLCEGRIVLAGFYALQQERAKKISRVSCRRIARSILVFFLLFLPLPGFLLPVFLFS